MNRTIKKMVRQEVRRALKPTGLIGKRGPAKNVPILVQRAVKGSKECSGSAKFGLGCSE